MSLKPKENNKLLRLRKIDEEHGKMKNDARQNSEQNTSEKTRKCAKQTQTKTGDNS